MVVKSFFKGDCRDMSYWTFPCFVWHHRSDFVTGWVSNSLFADSAIIGVKYIRRHRSEIVTVAVCYHYVFIAGCGRVYVIMLLWVGVAMLVGRGFLDSCNDLISKCCESTYMWTNLFIVFIHFAEKWNVLPPACLELYSQNRDTAQ